MREPSALFLPSKREAKASSQELLWQRFEEFAFVVFAEPLFGFVSRERALFFKGVFLAMHPFGFDVVEPGTFRGQRTHQKAASLSGGFDAAVMRLDPLTHFSAGVPARVVPYHHQHPLALLGQTLGHPRQKANRHLRHRAPLDKAQHHLARVEAQQTVARQRLGVRVVLFNLFGFQAQRLVARPSVEMRLG